MGQKCRNSGQNATHSAIQTRKKRASARPPLDCTKPWIPMRLADFCSLKVSDIDSDRRWGKPEPDQMLKHRPDTTRAASKTVVRVSVPWVRISPPLARALQVFVVACLIDAGVIALPALVRFANQRCFKATRGATFRLVR